MDMSIVLLAIWRYYVTKWIFELMIELESIHLQQEAAIYSIWLNQNREYSNNNIYTLEFISKHLWLTGRHTRPCCWSNTFVKCCELKLKVLTLIDTYWGLCFKTHHYSITVPDDWCKVYVQPTWMMTTPVQSKHVIRVFYLQSGSNSHVKSR